MQANLEVLKEPRGFIKLIEIILAICAFATAVGPHVTVSFTCCGSGTQIFQLMLHYPFQDGESNATTQTCVCTGISSTPLTTTAAPTSDAPTGSSSTSVSTSTTAHVKADETTTHMPSNEFQLPSECKSSSEFYVFIGVTAFLFSLGAVIFYVFAQDRYAGFGIIPKADFIVTIFFTVFWLISSSAFAAALSKIKYSTDSAWISAHHSDFFPECFSGSTCASNQDGNYSTLNVSVIFGFLNLIVWGGNNWFLYKETNWFGSTDSSSSLPPQSMSTSTSEIQPKV